MASAAPARSTWQRTLLLALNQGILRFARRWLAITNALAMLIAGLPLVGAWFASIGLSAPAAWIFTSYSITCTQVPSHSWYPWGVQLATCQRETSVYVSMALVGLAFVPFRRRWRPLPVWAFVLLIVPITVDGFTQLFGWRESNPGLRVLTGGLFGLAVVWLVYPRLQRGFAGMVALIEARFARIREREALVKGSPAR